MAGLEEWKKMLQEFEQINKPSRKTLEQAMEDGTISLDTYLKIKKRGHVGQIPEPMEMRTDSIPDRIERELASEDDMSVSEEDLSTYLQQRLENELRDPSQLMRDMDDMSLEEYMKKIKDEAR